MPDKFLTTVITDLAKLRIRIDSMPNQPLRSSMESEYQANRERLKNAVPVKFKDEIDGMIEAEIDRCQASKALRENIIDAQNNQTAESERRK